MKIERMAVLATAAVGVLLLAVSAVMFFVGMFSGIGMIAYSAVVALVGIATFQTAGEIEATFVTEEE